MTDVGPRDGLQNERTPVPTAVKVELINRLSAAGFSHIEATAFVSPQWVPQMADAAEVMTQIKRQPGVRYTALVPNMKGWAAAQAAQCDGIVVFGAASEAFSQRNINCSIEASIERFAPVCAAARAQGIEVQGSISCALGCPYQGAVSPEEVARVARLMKAIGIERMSVADTIGVGTPRAVQAVMEAVLGVYDLDRVGGHFHDSYGQGVANIYACLEMGIAQFDASIAGLGGCPYAVGATGNVATEDVLYLLRGLDIDTGIDFDRAVETGQWISAQLGRPSFARAGNAVSAKKGP